MGARFLLVGIQSLSGGEARDSIPEGWPPYTEPVDARRADRCPAWLPLAALALLVALTLAAAARTRPPAPLGLGAPATRFSGARARALSPRLLGDPPRPHPVGSAANAQVRARLLSLLRELGLAPREQRAFAVATRSAGSGEVVNVLARLGPPARPGARDSILLLAHYDSVAAGPGANDDGAGVVVLLEVARALLAGEPLARPVLLLFTEGEEAGLLGAEAFVAEPHPALAEVGAVIDVEARGSRGASLMFQIGPRSSGLVERLAAAASRPITGSTFTTVYERMPNDTDFSVFAAHGLPGLDFAHVGGVEHYHTPEDDLARLDPATLQHHGDSVLAVARSLARDGLPPPEADRPLVFFDVLGLLVVRWPAALSATLAGLGLLGVLAAAGLALSRQRACLGAALGAHALGLLAWLAVTLAAGGAVALVAWALAPPWPWPAEPKLALVAQAGAALAAASLAAWPFARRAGPWGVWAGAWTVWGLGGLALGALLPGVSYLLLAPTLVAAAAGLLAAPLARRSEGGALALATLLPLGAAGVLWLELLVLAVETLGLPSPVLPSPTPIAWVLLAGLLAPTLTAPGARGRPPLVLVGLALLIWGGLAAAASPPFTAEHRQQTALMLHHDAQTGRARWLALPFTAGRPAFLDASGATFSAERSAPAAWFPYATYAAPAPALGEQDQAFVVDERRVSRGAAGRRRVAFRITPRADARELYLALPAGAVPGSLRVEGRASPARSLLRIASCPARGVRVELEVAGAAPVELTLVDVRRGLPPSGEALLAARRAGNGTTAHRGDLTLVSRRIRLE